MNTMRLLQALRNQSARIAADLEDSKLFTHMGDRGTFRESVIQRFLRPFLPECYGLAAGEVFSSDGQQSAQIDIAVFDAVFSTILFRNGPTMLLPAESVFGSIEVKSQLTTGELECSCANIASVKRLPRAASDMLDFLPFTRFNASDQFDWDRAPLNPYVGIVFAYAGIAKESVTDYLIRRSTADPTNRHLLPDFVFVAKPGYLVSRLYQSDSMLRLSLPGGRFNGFGYLETGPDTLPLFYLALNICLNRIRLRAIDYVSLWSTLIGQAVEKNQAR